MHAVLNFTDFAREVITAPDPNGMQWQPVFVRLTPNEVEHFDALCRERRLAVIDVIDRQLADLAAVRFPSSRQIGHVARRLLLGQRVPPYCGNLDLDELVPSVRLTPRRT